jgi:hypothetical protein
VKKMPQRRVFGGSRTKKFGAHTRNELLSENQRHTLEVYRLDSYIKANNKKYVEFVSDLYKLWKKELPRLPHLSNFVEGISGLLLSDNNLFDFLQRNDFPVHDGRRVHEILGILSLLILEKSQREGVLGTEIRS